MSKEDIHAILGLAIVDQSFRRALLLNPIEAMKERGFTLTEQEQEAFRSSQATNIYDLSQHLIEKLFRPCCPENEQSGEIQ